MAISVVSMGYTSRWKEKCAGRSAWERCTHPFAP
jgi:hypothetical protein